MLVKRNNMKIELDLEEMWKALTKEELETLKV